MRRLIINADDFGLTTGVNRGIATAHGAGVITSATLMAVSAKFDEAVEIAKHTGSLQVGCHVVLIDGEPILSPRETASLLAPGRNCFRNGVSDFAAQAIRKRFKADEISHEALAQMRKILAAGIELTHFDTHKHTHMFTSVLEPLLRAARECGVRAVRNPFVPIKAVATAHIFRQPKLWKRYSEVRLMRTFAAQFQKLVSNAGLRTTDGTFGVIATGALDQKLFNAIIGSIPEGTWEFVCHPGYNDAELAQIRTRLRESREAELRVLTSPETKRQLHERGIDLVSFADL